MLLEKSENDAALKLLPEDELLEVYCDKCKKIFGIDPDYRFDLDCPYCGLRQKDNLTELIKSWNAAFDKMIKIIKAWREKETSWTDWNKTALVFRAASDAEREAWVAWQKGKREMESNTRKEQK